MASQSAAVRKVCQYQFSRQTMAETRIFGSPRMFRGGLGNGDLHRPNSLWPRLLKRLTGITVRLGFHHTRGGTSRPAGVLACIRAQKDQLLHFGIPDTSSRLCCGCRSPESREASSPPYVVPKSRAVRQFSRSWRIPSESRVRRRARYDWWMALDGE